ALACAVSPCVMDAPSTASYTLSLHDALPILKSRQQCGRSRTRTAPSPSVRPITPKRSTSFVKVSRGRPARADPAAQTPAKTAARSEEHTSEFQSRENLVCRLLLEKKNESE